MSADTTPEVLAGRYEIESVLGEGGMARVFRGTDKVLGRTVAVKVLSSQFARDDTSVRRFRREAQSAASLNHPNVVSVFDTGSDDGVHWIVMEYLDGRTLREVIDQDGAILPERAAEIAREVSLALATAHEKGIIHRDVKPANIMLTPTGETKVMDFGIARAVTSSGDPTLTRTGFVMGTAAYLSPEQAEGKPVDARSDIYSLGCVVYEMLTARPPFDGDSPVAIAGKHLSEEPEPISRVNPDVPPEVEAVVARAMRKNPDDRYQEAREMSDDLGRAVTGELLVGALAAGAATEPVHRPKGDTQVLPTAIPEPLRESFRRSPWLPAALMAVLLALLAFVATVLLIRANDDPSSRGGGARESPTQSPSPSPSPSPEGPPSVEEAFAMFSALVNEGFASDQITAEAAAELLDDVRQVLEAYRESDFETATEQLDELRQTIDGYLEDGQITSSRRAEDLHDATDLLEEAMALSGGEEGDSGGQGKGKGKGKGKGNDEDGDDD